MDGAHGKTLSLITVQGEQPPRRRLRLRDRGIELTEDIGSTNLEQHHWKTCKARGTTHKSEHQQQMGRIHMAGSLSGVVDCDDAVGRNVPLSVFPCTSLVGGKTGLAFAPQFLDAGWVLLELEMVVSLRGCPLSIMFCCCFTSFLVPVV